ncbi:MAG: HeH/LEM domain protein [Chaetfec virus UA24_244]|nr:MAG: HeH/LEM domain protein [Chaetfec virus UA24_244]
MFKITGKQRFGAAYRNGKCIATFRNRIGYTDTADDADYLKKKGYTVEGGNPADLDPLAGMTAKELTAYAVGHGIDLTGVPNSKGKILAAIREVEPLSTADETGEE